MGMPLGLSGQPVLSPSQKSRILESSEQVQGSIWSMHQLSPV
jgi:hypothetical protein